MEFEKQKGERRLYFAYGKAVNIIVKRGKIMEENKQLSPKLDVVFKMLFGEPQNEKATIGLLEDVIKEKIDTIDLEESPYLMGEQVNDKVRNYRRPCKNK